MRMQSVNMAQGCQLKNRIGIDKMKQNRGHRGGEYLSLALWAFGGLGMEGVYAFFLEPLLYGVEVQEFSGMQTILHWIATCLTWGLFACVLIRKSAGKYEFDLLEKREPLKYWQWIVCAAFILLAFAASYRSWDGFKVYLEFAGKGVILFSFQYLYYLFETMLFALIIVFGQKACEVWFGKEQIPYGGIICGITWGLAHIFTKDLLTGVMGMFLGFAMGSVYLLVNRDFKKAYVILFLMFVL